VTPLNAASQRSGVAPVIELPASNNGTIKKSA
jgi:hypothetical protein